MEALFASLAGPGPVDLAELSGGGGPVPARALFQDALVVML